MTAYELVERYAQEHGELPLPYSELVEFGEYAQRLGVDLPEPDSLIAVVQMMRQAQDEAIRRNGQMTLI